MWFRFPTVAKEFNYGTNIIIKIYNIKIFSIFNKFIAILLTYKKLYIILIILNTKFVSRENL